jgi:peptide deformylase
MAIRPVITLPDSKLRLASKLVTIVDASTRALLDDMLETMYDAPGIGLAAVQIGIMQRLVVIDTAKQEEPRTPLCLVNPEITWRSEETSSYEEGCLSIPDYYEEVTRPEKVRVRFLDRDGQPQEMEADGILATVVQHEIDHLDGVLFVDHISKLKRDRVIRKFEKAARVARENGVPFNPREGDGPLATKRAAPARRATTAVT